MRKNGLAEADVVICVCKFGGVDSLYEVAVASLFDFVAGDEHFVPELIVIWIESEVDLLFLYEQFSSFLEQSPLEFEAKQLNFR